MSTTMDRPIPRSRWRSKPAIALVSLIAVGAVTAVAWTARGSHAMHVARQTAAIATVENAVFHDFVALRASVMARDVVYLDAQEGGRVQRVLIEAGDNVAAGQPLVEFGNTDLQLQVIEREAWLIEQINALRSAEVALEQNRIANDRSLAEVEYNIVRLAKFADRRRTLATQGITSLEDKDNALNELAYYTKLQPLVAKSNETQEALRGLRLPELHDGLRKLQEDLTVTRGKLDNLIVRAPVAGRLTDIDLKLGQNCDRGQRLAQITPETGFKLSGDVDEFYLGRVRVGQKADVRSGDADVPVNVTKVYPQVKDGRFTIDLLFDGAAPDSLITGQTLQGKLRLGQDKMALVLPAGAFLEDTGGDWVFVVDSGGSSAQRRRIKAGRRNAEQLEVLDGLRSGERVLISSYQGLERFEHLELTH